MDRARLTHRARLGLAAIVAAAVEIGLVRILRPVAAACRRAKLAAGAKAAGAIGRTATALRVGALAVGLGATGRAAAIHARLILILGAVFTRGLRAELVFAELTGAVAVHAARLAVGAGAERRNVDATNRTAAIDVGFALVLDLVGAGRRRALAAAAEAGLAILVGLARDAIVTTQIQVATRRAAAVRSSLVTVLRAVGAAGHCALLLRVAEARGAVAGDATNLPLDALFAASAAAHVRLVFVRLLVFAMVGQGLALAAATHLVGFARMATNAAVLRVVFGVAALERPAAAIVVAAAFPTATTTRGAAGLTAAAAYRAVATTARNIGLAGLAALLALKFSMLRTARAECSDAVQNSPTRQPPPSPRGSAEVPPTT